MPTKLNSLSQLRGVSDKRACLVATVGNIAFTGITQIDGITLSNDDRVLVWQQSISSENGIYILSGSTNLVRTVDSKNVSDFTQGTQYFVVSGNTYNETLFYLKNKVTTLGVDDIIIDIFGGLNGTSGTSGSSGTSGTSGIILGVNKILFGTHTGGQFGTVTFPSAFSSTPTVVATIVNTGAQFIAVNSVSTTSFNFARSSSGTIPFNWIAIN